MRVLTTSLLSSTVILALGGCSPMAASMATSSTNRAASATPTVPVAAASPLACLNNKVDFAVNTNVVDFEMQAGGGIKAGFGPGSSALANLDVNISYDEGQLDTTMSITDPLLLSPTTSLLNIAGSATKTNLTFGVNFLVGMFNIGPSVYYGTTVADLSMSALQDNLTKLSAGLAQISTETWWQPISQMDSQKGFFIAAGGSAGIQVGDTFEVMDVTYQWGGDQTPCTNPLLMPYLNSTTPLATATATQVTPTTTYLTIKTATGPLSQYMYVAPLTLPSTAAPCTTFLGIGCPSTTASRTLLHSMRLGTVTARPMTFNGPNSTSVTIDMTPFVNTQLSTLLDPTAGNGFYLHN